MTDSAGGDLPSQPETEHSQAREARTFVVLAVAAGFTAWDLGFDLGAFENVDHRRFWAIWLLCTIALVASYLFRDTDFGRIGQWRLVLAVPSVWLVLDLVVIDDNPTVAFVLIAISAIAVPLALMLLVELLAPDFFTLAIPRQLALAGLVVAIFAVGLYVGSSHERFLTCTDFARAGDFVPENCVDP